MKKKLNEKGFALTEVLITSVIVITMFGLLFTIVYPMIGANQASEKYEDLDTKYIAFYLKSMIESDSVFSPGSMNESICGSQCATYDTKTMACRMSGGVCVTDSNGIINFNIQVPNIFTYSDHYVVTNDLCNKLQDDNTRWRKNNRYKCNRFIREAKVNKIVMTPYSNLTNFKNGVASSSYFTRSFKEYVKYMAYHNNASSTMRNKYNLLIVEVEHDSHNTFNEKYYTYASIRVMK